MLRVGSGKILSTMEVGIVQLLFNNNKYLFLNNVYFISGFKCNLTSISKLTIYFSFFFYIDSISLNKNGMNIYSGYVENSLFLVKLISHNLLQTEMFKVAEPTPKRRKISSENNDIYLWHLRLGHININWIGKLVKDGPLNELEIGTLSSMNLV